MFHTHTHTHTHTRAHKFWEEKNPNPEYYNREVKRLKMKVRKAYKGRKLGQFLQADLKRLYIKKKLRSVLQNEGK